MAMILLLGCSPIPGQEPGNVHDLRASPEALTETRGLDRATAILLSSVAMDLVVTQVVDGTKGIHAMIPKQVFGE